MKLKEGKRKRHYQILTVPPVPALQNIGIYPGQRVEVRFQYPFSGPVIVRIYRRDFAIGGTIAEQIRIKEL